MPNIRPFILTLILALAIALVASSCGSSDESGGETTTVTLAKVQLIKQADAICRKADEKQEAAFTKFGEENPEISFRSQKGQEELMEAAGIPPVAFELEELQKLAPEADAASYEAILQNLEAALTKSEAQPMLLALGPKGPFAKANELATSYGFKDCADFL